MVVSILNFIYELGMLKRIEHEGIRVAGVETPERVADHALRACQIGYLLASVEAPESVFDVTAMLVWHDIGECRIGDIHKIANRYLEADEAQAVADQLAPLGNLGQNIKNLWQQFEDKKTLPAIMAKDADKLEHTVAVKEYLDAGHSFSELWINNSQKLGLSANQAQKLLAEIKNFHSSEWALGLSTNATMPVNPATTEIHAQLRFIFELAQLRRIHHEGFRLSGVLDPDSVASHTLRAAQIGYILATMENYPNPAEVATLVVWHDLEECRTGDVHKVANHYIKKNGLQAVLDQTAPLGKTGEAIKDLWQRVKDKSDEAAIIAKDADYLEIAVTAQEYIEQGYKTSQDMINNVAKTLRTKSAQAIIKELPQVSPFAWWQGLKKMD